MNMGIRRLIVDELRNIAQRIESGKCEMSEQQTLDILSAISHQPYSKTQAYMYLDIGRSQFDQLVRDGILPKGRKRVGFKELVWYKDELDKFKFKK